MIEDLDRYYQVPPPPTGRPWVIVSMITSVDGATAVGGRSGGLGNEVDKAIFRLARAAADVILVAAGTVRAETYRPVLPPRRLAIVTRSEPGSVDLGPAGGLLDAPTTTLVTPTRHGQDVDLAAALARWPARTVLCEGGPSLNGALLGAGLVDEVFLTLSPRLIGGDSPRLANAGAEADPAAWELRHLLTEDGFVFLRYRRR
ncbi:MAG: dihydrofolate reductase family protein [Acidimicrobiales bacterium]